MLLIDLEAASVPYAVEGTDGLLYADFPALRHPYGALLEQTGPPSSRPCTSPATPTPA